MNSSRVFLILAALISCQGLSAQSTGAVSERSAAPASNLSLHLEPSIDFPIGASSPLFSLGGSIGLSARYRLPSRPLFFLTGGLDYALNPLKMDAVLNKLSAGGGLGVNVPLGSRFTVVAFATGGYSYDFLSPATSVKGSGSPFAVAGAGGEFLLRDKLGIGLGAMYKNYFGLYSAISAYAGSSYHLPAMQRLKQKRPGGVKPELLGTGQILELSMIRFENIFPVFRKYYDDHPIGTAQLQNPYNKPATDIKVTLFIRQYMDVPKVCTAPRELPGGATQPLQLNALFTEKVLDITEATKAAAEISIEYTYEGQRYKSELSETIRVFDRNAMTWDDDRKAAAFVTAKDPMVLTFSKNVAGMIKDKGSRAVDQNLLLVVALQKALSLYGMTYIVDPRTPYAEYSKTKEAIDFLQFPRQSLEYKAGDCDDLSILYSSLLGSLGVEAAFITVPGHILIAAALQLGPEEARKSFSNPEELIFRDGKVWIPVEVTELKQGFLEAWQTGAREWAEYSTKDAAGFYPVFEAWKSYEPVGLPPGGRELVLPSEDKIVSGYLQEVVRFIDREILPRATMLRGEIDRTGSARAMNNLGVLYARYGLQDKAGEQFRSALKKEELVPALINLGNISYLNGDMSAALAFYERAYRKDPANPNVLLCVARANQGLGRFEIAQQTFKKLEVRDPEMAKQFAYLNLSGSDSNRAADVSGLKEKVLWQDE